MTALAMKAGDEVIEAVCWFAGGGVGFDEAAERLACDARRDKNDRLIN